MKILWISWKDIKNPQAGGAEIIADKLLSNLTKDRHSVKLLSSSFLGAKKVEKLNGYEIVRTGNRYTVYWETYKYYKKHLASWPDLIIEEINTMPFLSTFYVNKKTKLFLFFHQLCREIWFYEIFFPLNIIGYLLEPIYLWLMRKNRVITVSNSTKNDLMKYGFNKNNIDIISEGINLEVTDKIPQNKLEKYTILSLGAIRPMKRVHDQIEAFELAKKEIPGLTLQIAGGGNGKYFKRIMKMIKKSNYASDIQYLGPVSEKVKKILLAKSTLVLASSIREGWCLVVTEANSQGTPAVGYNVSGIRDSIINGKTGILAKKNNPRELSKAIVYILKDRKKYLVLANNAREFSKKMNYKSCYLDFKKIVFDTK